MNNLENIQCLDCEGHNVQERLVQQQFQYGAGADSVTLIAMVPVISCVDCGYEFFDERGEQARHAAVCRHLGVYTPDELTHLRKKAGLSRAEGCALTGFGIASWQRWESGGIPPNTSSDRLLYLLQFPENVSRLKERKRQSQSLVQAESSTEPLFDTAAGARPREKSTRCSFKQFGRFPNSERVAAQAQAWTLRKH